MLIREGETVPIFLQLALRGTVLDSPLSYSHSSPFQLYKYMYLYYTTQLSYVKVLLTKTLTVFSCRTAEKLLPLYWHPKLACIKTDEFKYI